MKKVLMKSVLFYKNTRIGSPNEEELIFIKLVGSNGEGLPVEAMKSGYPIKLGGFSGGKVSFIPLLKCL